MKLDGACVAQVWEITSLRFSVLQKKIKTLKLFWFYHEKASEEPRFDCNMLQFETF